MVRQQFLQVRHQEFTYKDCQEEMNMFNKAFCELMIQGDAEGKPFAYPIPTYNIHKRFDWDNPNNELIWEMAGKYGYPYITNYINSDMNPEDARSMCCRLRLDLRELRKTNVGIDWSMFNGRLSVTLDGYYKYTKNLLMNVPLPAPNPSIYRNEGEMSNWGLELALSSVNIDRNDWRWTTDFTTIPRPHPTNRYILQNCILIGQNCISYKIASKLLSAKLL